MRFMKYLIGEKSVGSVFLRGQQGHAEGMDGIWKKRLEQGVNLAMAGNRSEAVKVGADERQVEMAAAAGRARVASMQVRVVTDLAAQRFKRGKQLGDLFHA